MGVDECRGKMSPLTGEPIQVIGAGCTGVWVGTRFIATDEAGAGPTHKKRVLQSSYDETLRTIMYTGRPLRIFKTPYSVEMEEKRQDVIKQMSAMGIPAWIADMDAEKLEGANAASVGTLNLSETRTQEEIKKGVVLSAHERHARGVYLTGQCAGAITDIKPAKDVVDDMVTVAADIIRSSQQLLSKL